jgi:hypothetical protein
MKMNRIRLIVTLILVSGALFLPAQVDSVYYGSQPAEKSKQKEAKNDAWKENVVWGGNVQLRVGNPTFILLSPSVGYMPFKKFIVGVGGIYNYVSLRSYYGDYSQSIFGTHTFARYTVGSGFFLQAQYDRLLQPDHMSPEPNDKAWVDYLMIGGGFIQSVNDKLALTTSIMYNIHHNPLSIYPSRLIIQFGVTGSF